MCSLGERTNSIPLAPAVKDAYLALRKIPIGAAGDRRIFPAGGNDGTEPVWIQWLATVAAHCCLRPSDLK